VSTLSLVAPFAGERYRADLAARVAPPYDVISPSEREGYAGRDPRNIVHLILPAGSGDRYAHAARLLASWRAEATFARDPAAVYVMAQRFTLPSGERRTRLGCFAAIAAEPFAAGRVRPHERTHAAPKADRLALLEATTTNLESIFLLAPDPDRRLAQALARTARGVPAGRTTLDGVDIRLWVAPGEAGAELARLAGRGPLYIADGHHRYETAAAYAARRPGSGAERVLGFVVAADDPGLVILPTHRIVARAPADPQPLIERWRTWFDVGRVAPCADRGEHLALLGRTRTACIVALPSGADLSLVLKPDAPLAGVTGLGRTDAVRVLDVARADALVVGPLLAGAPAGALSYTPDLATAFDAVRQRGAAAVLLNPPGVAQVFAVADAGDVMPPKSTYFMPKVPSGLVLRPLPERPE